MLKVAKLGGYKILGCCTLFYSFATVIERGGDRVWLPQCYALLLVHRSINWGSWLCTGLSRQIDEPDRAGLKESPRTRPCLGSCRGSSLGFETSLDFRCSQCSGTACHLAAQECTVQTFQLSQKISKNTQQDWIHDLWLLTFKFLFPMHRVFLLLGFLMRIIFPNFGTPKYMDQQSTRGLQHFFKHLWIDSLMGRRRDSSVKFHRKSRSNQWIHSLKTWFQGMQSLQSLHVSSVIQALFFCWRFNSNAARYKPYSTFQSFQVLQLFIAFWDPWLLRGAKQQPLHADTLRIGGMKAWKVVR